MAKSLQRRPKLFRDPIHDVISYDRDTPFGALIVALIDAEPVQRLRRIRQLGLAHFVYHGAEHSRFAHSMGVAKFADRMFSAIHRGESPPEDLRMATVAAALLHDVGHAPFSHTFETMLQGVLGFEEDHEDFTRRILLWEDGDVHRILAERDAALPQTVADIIAHQSGLYTEPIVSSQLDADRMDYLLRDGYMTGVQNYHYDAGRILEMLMHDEHGLVVDQRALQAVESYLLSRFHMYQQVYYHHTVRAAETQMACIFKRVLTLLQCGDLELLPEGPLGRLLLAALNQEEVDIADYLAIDEHTAWVAIRAWGGHGDPILTDLCSAFEARRFPKTIIVPAHDLRRFLETTRGDIDELVQRAGYDPTYYTALDKAEDTPFRPYEPHESTQPQQKPLPFDESGETRALDPRVLAGQAIRMHLGGGRIAPIEEISPVADALTRIHHRVYRYCVPEKVREAAQELVTTRHPG